MSAEVAAVSWACPDAHLILTADAPRERWLAERRNGIGGSDASTIAGVNRFTSRYELWLDKTGQLPEKDPTPAMVMGNKLEPVIAECFTETTGLQVRRAGLMASRSRPWQRVNVDRLVADGGVLECKKTNWRMADEWDGDQVADHAEVQVQHGLAVTGRPHAWVAFMVDGQYPEFRRVERDEELIATLTAMEDTFWHDNVIAGVAPPIDHPSALDVLKSKYPTVDADIAAGGKEDLELLAQWQELRKQEHDITSRKKVTEAIIRERIGAAEGLSVYGNDIATLRATGTFSATRFAKDHPELVGEYMTVKTVPDVERIKTEHPDLYTKYRARVLRAVTTTKGK